MELPKHDIGPGASENGGSAAPKVFSITQYGRSVERLLKAQVPKIWVKGVITQLNQRGRIAYLTLGEFEEGDARPRAVLEVTLWTSELEVFNLRFSRLPIPLALRVDLKVALLLEANFYVPSGRFQPRVLDIDEKFTIGELTLTRQKILERLHKEGLIRSNKERMLIGWPLRVGLITAPGSAAYQDFTTVLLQSGFSFRISFAGAKMQGEATEASVLHALAALQRLPLDVICIVRGGGAKTDLVYFDSEAICRAIAACKVPVLTGIGHEIDNSLADLVAHGNKITPTDCAKFLENQVGECYARLAAYHREVAEIWKMECQEGWHGLAQRAAAFKHHWEGRRATEELRFREQARALASLARQTLRAETRRLHSDHIGLMRGPAKILGMQRLRFANRTQAIDHAWRRLKADSRHELRARWTGVRDGTKRLLAAERRNLRMDSVGLSRGPLKIIQIHRLSFTAHSQALAYSWNRLKRECEHAMRERFSAFRERSRQLIDANRAAGAQSALRVKSWWNQGFRAGMESLSLKERLIRAADPIKMLNLGYSLLYGKDGKLIRSVSQVAPEDVLVSRLQDGTVESRVIARKAGKAGKASNIEQSDQSKQSESGERDE